MFWKEKSLEELSESEWESLCDGCGKCCLHKIEDEDTDELFYTRIACRYLDLKQGGCSQYRNRQHAVPECVQLKPEDVQAFNWLPRTCAYRLVAQGQMLPDWHPLISGDPRSVHESDISVIRWAVSEDEVDGEAWFDQVLEGVEL
jgi:hypothetical protein